MVLVLAVPAYAQLGYQDNSSFTIQNLGGAEALVTVTFYTEAGVAATPNPILPGPDGTCGTADDVPNPFPVASAAKQEIYMPAVCGLDDGRYSVVIESTEPVAVIANLIGETDGVFYNGSYSGFDDGAATVYFPATVHQYYNWNSLISVQNVTDAPISADLVIFDAGGNQVGTDTQSIPAFASYHWDLETANLGLPADLNGSAKVDCTGACVGTDNQTAAGGFTQSYGGFLAGDTTLFAPALYNSYYTWDSSLKVQNVGDVDAHIDVTYTLAGGTSCSAPTETIAPNQALFHYLPSEWVGWGCDPSNDIVIGAVVTSDQPVVGVSNAANPAGQAQTYGAFATNDGALMVGLPVIMHNYYGWDTSFTCQNLDDTATANVSYSYSGIGCPVGTCSFALDPGEAHEVYQPTDLGANEGLFAVTVTATGGEVACIANETLGANQGGSMGDWSMSYNGFGQ
jgi:hypothetical protein